MPLDTGTMQQFSESGGGASQGPGGPGPDTPQEQQALQLIMTGVQQIRQASTVEPSIRYIVDQVLEKFFLDITKHYGLEQEGKLALQQQRLDANRRKSAPLMGPPTAPAGQPPTQ